MSGGTKNDAGKADTSLFSWLWLIGVARTLTKGKKKYGAHNWRLKIQIARIIAGVIRHIILFMAGQDYDVDPKCEACKNKNCLNHTGEHHLTCASCGLMFAYEMVLTNPEVDDRYKYDANGIQALLNLTDMLFNPGENDETISNNQDRVPFVPSGSVPKPGEYIPLRPGNLSPTIPCTVPGCKVCGPRGE